MSFEKKYEEWKKKKQTEEKENSVGTSFEDRYTNWQIRTNGEEILNNLSTRFNSWLSDYDSLAKDYSSRYSNVDASKYRSDTDDWLSKISSRVQSNTQEAREIKKIVEQYKDYLDPEWVSNFNKAINNAYNYGVDMTYGAKSEKDYWSQWDNEDAYYDSYYGSKYAGYSYEDIKKIIKGTHSDPSGYDTFSDKHHVLSLDGTNKHPVGDFGSETRINTDVDQRELDWLGKNLDYFMSSEEAQKEIDFYESVKEGHRKMAAGGDNFFESIWNQAKATFSPDSAGKEYDEKISKYKNIKRQAARREEYQQFASVTDESSEFFDPDFESYVKLGEEKGLTPAENRSAGPYTNGIIAERNGKNSYMAAADDHAKYMTDDEYKLYAYYYGKYGEEKANEFFVTIQENLNTREAVDVAKDTNALEAMFYAVYAGLDQFGQGMQSLFSDAEYHTPSTAQIASGMIRENLADTGAKLPDWLGGGSLGQLGYDAIHTTSNMLPSILASAGANFIAPGSGAVVGTTLMGASAAGHGKAEMINLGYSQAQANAYGLMVGASEAGLQYFLGGITSLGGNSTGLTKLALSKVDNTFARVAISLGGSMLSEGFEEGLQTVIEPWLKEIATGVDWESPDIDEVLYNSLLGALSAFGLEGGQTVAGEVNYSQALTNNGKGILSTNGGYDSLKNLATDVSSEGLVKSEANVGKLLKKTQTGVDAINKGKASKVQTNKTAKKVALLSKSVDSVRNEQNLAEIRSSLESKGLSKSQANKAAQLLNEALYTDGAYSKELYKSVMKDEGVWDTLRELVSSPDSTLKSRNLKHKLGRVGLKVGENGTIVSSVSTEGTESGYVDESLSFVEDASKREYTASTEGKTIVKTTGDTVDIVEVASIKDGQMMLKVKDADGVETEVNARDVEYSSGNEALIYEAVAHMGLNAVSANSIIKSYNPTQNAGAFARGVQEAYRYGKYNYSENEMYREGSFLHDLTDAQIQRAYKLGQIQSGSDTAVAVAKLKEAIANSKGKKGESKVHFEGDAVGIDENKLNDRQRVSLKTMEMLSKALGIEFYVYSSYVNKNGERVYKTADGKVKPAPNGVYDKVTGAIHIDLNAGEKGEGTMLFTVAHELTHFIKAWSPAKFKVLANFLVEQYGKKGMSVEELVRRQMANMKANGRTNVTYEKAFEEFVADSMQTMLTSGNVIESLAEIKRRDEGLWNKIKEFFTDLVEHLKKVVNAYSEFAPDTVEGQTVAEMTDVIEQLEKLFAEGLVDASENFRAISSTEAQTLAEVGIGFDAETQSVAPELFSERTWRASEYVQNKEEAIKTIAKQLGVSESKARQYVDDINSIARLIADDRVRLDYEPNMDDGATVLKPNSEYKYTVDMSTLCAKRLLFTGTFDAIQKALPNTVFDSDDIVRLRKMMQDRNLEVACGICYVESTRREIGRITQEFIDRYKVAQKTGKPITRVNSSGKEVALSAKGKTFMADPNYTPNLGELNTTDIDIVKRDHREVYDAYLAFMNARGQAKPKLLETRAEYKGEILKHFKAKSAVNSRNAHGGLRLQSFSDFEVPHMIDMMQVIMDMSRVGLKSQAYTKVPAFAEVFGGTGVKINLSLIAKGSGLDANGNLVFDDVEGINHKEAFRLRDKYSRNVGTILVGKSDAHIIAAMADPRIDFIIPFHKSSWKESLYDALGLKGYDDYTEAQNEKPIDKERKIENFDPSEYWDFSKSGDENAQIYLQKCREDGRIPKFAQFQSYPGYWKLLIDFKMYDNNGIGVPQEVVQPNFDMDSANRILSEYKGGHKTYPVAKDVVEDFVKEFSETKATDNMMFSERNFSFNELVARDDLVGFVIGNKVQVPLTADGSIDGKAIIDAVHKRCKTVQTKATTPTYYLDVPDIGRKVEVIDKSITHGFFKGMLKSKTPAPSKILNAKISLALPEILANSIEVNRSYRDGNLDIPYSHVMMGTVGIEGENGSIEYYAVRSVIEERTNLNPILVEAEVLGKLHAVNAKKIGLPNFRDVKKNVALEHNTAYFGYSVAQFLEDVKWEFDDTFSLDVYNTLSAQRRKTPFSDNLLYSDRNKDSVSNRSLLANALESAVTNEFERKTLNDYKEELGRADALEKELGEIRSKIRELSFAKGRKDTEALKKLREQEVKTVNRIDIRDKKLLRLEATKPLKDIIHRERQKAYKRAEKEGKEALAKYREKTAETQRELLNRWQESRHKAVEGRNKTAMRHKIRGIVSELNNLLLHGTKDKHVMIGLQKAVASALDAVNMDTVGAEERVAKYNALIAKEKNPDIIESLTATRDRILAQGNNIGEKLANLKNAYSEIKNSDDPLIANSYDEVIFSKIEAVVESVGNTPLRDMSLSQLEDVYDLYKMVLTTIRNSNKAFKAKKGEEISVLSNRVMEEVEAVGGKKNLTLKATEGLKKYGWSILKPVYAFKLIGSKTFSEVFDNVRAGEDTWAKDVSEAKDFRTTAFKKYNYKNWDFNKKFTFTSKSGTSFELTLEQILSLYAYSKRKQADDHLEKGGFVFDTAIEVTEKKHGIPLKYNVNTATAHQVSKETLAQIIGNLTTEQKGFVDEMQDYLSSVMGEKGNEVSLEMYGVKLFKEKFYFPLKSARQFMFEQNEVAGEVKIKNSGFSKETVAHANNPIILNNFMDVWANHVNDMSMYHSFVLALEDFNRVYNYKTPTTDDMQTESVKMYLQNAYGTQSADYIKQLLTDLNGGARSDPQAGILNKALGKFKKAKVFASLSVVIQQPSALGRAFAYVDPKYFVGKKVNKNEQMKTWSEVKKYAPVAIIKEMGYFDVGNGRSTVSYLKGDKSVMDYVDDVASWLPAKADELTWCTIWEAVKRETADKNKTLKVGSEEFLKVAGERFTEVIVNTQVYDSVLSRSGMMRSKDTGVKMATAFMAESTTAMNMMVDAHLQTKRGNKKFARKIRGGVVASIVINSILVSLVYASRDDDEDETYIEKYLGSLTSELIDGFNPLTYLPYVKDLWSIAQGYDIERSDMSVFADLTESVEKLFDEDASALDKVTSFTGDVTNLFGLPTKNVLRDVKALFNVANGIIEGTPTTSAGIGYSVMDSVRNAVPIWGRLDSGPSASQKLYNALASGNKAQINRLKGGYKDEEAYENAVRKALRENDSRIKKAAQARIDGNTEEYKRIAREIISEGHFTQDQVVTAITAEMTKLKKDKPKEEDLDYEETTSMYSASDINYALDNGNTDGAREAIDDLISAKVETYVAKAKAEAEKDGKTFSETKAKREAKAKAESSVKSAISSYWKPKYKEAYKKGDTEEMKRIRYILRDTKLYGSVSDILDTCKGWLKD